VPLTLSSKLVTSRTIYSAQNISAFFPHCFLRFSQSFGACVAGYKKAQNMVSSLAKKSIFMHNISQVVLKCRCTDFFKYCFDGLQTRKAESWFRRLVAGLSRRRSRFSPVHIRLLVDKTVLGEVTLTALRFIRVNVIPHIFQSLLHLRVTLATRIND